MVGSHHAIRLNADCRSCPPFHLKVLEGVVTACFPPTESWRKHECMPTLCQEGNQMKDSIQTFQAWPTDSAVFVYLTVFEVEADRVRS